MKKYSYKKLNYGFIILCPEHTINLLKTTANSIKSNYPNIPFICVTDSSSNKDDLKEMKDICPSFKGKETISSLMNEGLYNAPAEWNFFICAGATVRPNIDKRFSLFVETEKDILYPIADGKHHFSEATINGLYMHKNVIKEVGKIPDLGPLEVVKLMWALSAIDHGYKFKAITGSKIC